MSFQGDTGAARIQTRLITGRLAGERHLEVARGRAEPHQSEADRPGPIEGKGRVIGLTFDPDPRAARLRRRHSLLEPDVDLGRQGRRARLEENQHERRRGARHRPRHVDRDRALADLDTDAAGVGAGRGRAWRGQASRGGRPGFRRTRRLGDDDRRVACLGACGSVVAAADRSPSPTSRSAAMAGRSAGAVAGSTAPPSTAAIGAADPAAAAEPAGWLSRPWNRLRNQPNHPDGLGLAPSDPAPEPCGPPELAPCAAASGPDGSVARSSLSTNSLSEPFSVSFRGDWSLLGAWPPAPELLCPAWACCVCADVAPSASDEGSIAAVTDGGSGGGGSVLSPAR